MLEARAHGKESQVVEISAIITTASLIMISWFCDVEPKLFTIDVQMLYCSRIKANCAENRNSAQCVLMLKDDPVRGMC